MTKKTYLSFAFVFLIFSSIYLTVAKLPLSLQLKTATLDLLYLVPPGLAVISTSLAIKKTEAKEKKFWLYLAIANSLLFLGEIIWVYYEVFQGLNEPPYPSLADYAYLSGYLFFFLALIFLTNFSHSFILAKVRYLLDIIITSFVSFILVWFFLLRPIYANETVSIAEKITNIIYPTADLAILFGLLANVSGFKVSKWRSWEVLVALGLVATGIGDIFFNYFSVTNTYQTSNFGAKILDLSWAAGYYAFFLAGLTRLSPQKPKPPKAIGLFEQPSFSWTDFFVPLLILASTPLFLYLAIYKTSNNFNQMVLIVSATLLSMLVVARSAVVVAENSRLFTYSITDPLTRLYNHRFFEERLGIELERVKRYGEKLSLAILDLDNFTQINNLYGHLEGDKVLKQVAQSLKGVIRASDTFCRLGGDEFALIMLETSPLEALQVCLKMQKRLKELKLLDKVILSFSAGISSFPEHALDAADLTSKADSALFWAKFHGKEQVTVYDAQAVKPLTTEERLRRMEEMSYLETVQALAAAVDARDPATQHHSRNVASLAVLLAEKIGLDSKRVKLIETAALLHDVGKIGIPDKILNKRQGLTAKEREQIQAHPLISQKIVSATTFKEILPWIVSHHERWDGQGYPQGLKEHEIPLEARILAICDTYDAITSSAPYKKALSVDTALKELEKAKGKQLDPNLTDIFMQLISQTAKV